MPPAEPAGRGGPSRKTPVVLLIVAALLLVARVATGVIEAGNPFGPQAPVQQQPVIQIE